MSISEVAYPVETLKIILPIMPELFDDYSDDTLAMLREAAEHWANVTFEGQRAGVKAHGAKWHSERYVKQEYDPETLAPYEEPRYYYIATVKVW